MVYTADAKQSEMEFVDTMLFGTSAVAGLHSSIVQSVNHHYLEISSALNQSRTRKL